MLDIVTNLQYSSPMVRLAIFHWEQIESPLKCDQKVTFHVVWLKMMTKQPFNLFQGQFFSLQEHFGYSRYLVYIIIYKGKINWIP